MRKIKYYIIPLIVATFFVFTSCNDTYEFHEKYIEGGEIIYSTKVDSLVTLPGEGRIKIAGYLTNAFSVNEIEVYWNKGENSQTFSYTKSDNDEADLIELIVVGLEEQSYEFDIYSIDVDGNRSIKVTTFGTVYGETYRSNLESRAFNKIAFGADDNATISLKPSSDLTRGTEIKFTNLSGVEVVNVVLADDSETVLEQVDIAAPIMYRTNYVPTPANEDGIETSIDEFPSDWKTFEAPTTFDPIFASLTFESIPAGVIANWENSENVEMTFTFQNMVEDIPVSSTIASSGATDSFTIEGMEIVTQNIEIMLTDIYGNSKSLFFEVTPEAPLGGGKGDWSIVDFSSEEPTEANWGPPIQGSAAAAIDGDFGTFWHSAWANSSPVYPHYFTIDLGEEKSIAGFEVFRRSGNGGGATVHEFWVSSDNVNFTKVATLNAQLTSNDGFIAMADEITTGRYVKYVAVEGSNTFTHLSEINVIESLDKSNWSVADFSSEEPTEANWGPPIQGSAAAVFDDDLGTFWHSAWANSSPVYPHYFTIDLGSEQNIAGYEVFRRSGNGGGATVHEFWVSSDNITFTKVATLNAQLTSNDGFAAMTDEITTGRYVKYIAVEGSNTFTHLSEINIYGTRE